MKGEKAMALIDIMKLNEELDKMIATQEAEIKQIDEEIYNGYEEKWKRFAADISEMMSIAYKIGGKQCRKGIYVVVRCDNNRAYTLEFNHYGGVVIWFGFKTGAYCGTIPYKSSYDVAKHSLETGNFKVINEILDAWNYEDAQRQFEDGCVKAIKQKAEVANANYQAALNRKEKANV